MKEQNAIKPEYANVAGKVYTLKGDAKVVCPPSLMNNSKRQPKGKAKKSKEVRKMGTNGSLDTLAK